MLYWSIGRDILDQQRAGGWSDDIVGRIADDLCVEIGSTRGFSRRNLFYVRKFAALWPDPEKVRPLAAKLAGPTSRCFSSKPAARKRAGDPDLVVSARSDPGADEVRSRL